MSPALIVFVCDPMTLLVTSTFTLHVPDAGMVRPEAETEPCVPDPHKRSARK